MVNFHLVLEKRARVS